MTADTEHRPQPMVGPDSRRLMAVVFVDAVGFSSQIEQDEAGAHAQWSLVKRQVIEPEVQAKGGRIIKSTGDGYLFEFPSAVAGVQFALDAQAGMRSLAEQGRVTLTLRARRVSRNMPTRAASSCRARCTSRSSGASRTRPRRSASCS